MEGKNIIESKTFWVNAIAAATMVAQSFTGISVLAEPATQATVLALVNIVLRSVTREGVRWT